MAEETLTPGVAEALDEGGSKLGPNPFEQVYNNTAETQSAGPTNVEAGAGTVVEGTAPVASPEAGVETINQGQESSFLSSEEHQTFDTNSPEYKAMQASYTRKMQELAEQRRQLEGYASQMQMQQQQQQPQEEAAPTPQGSGVNWETVAFTGYGEEYEDIEPKVNQAIREHIEHAVTELRNQALVDQQQVQQDQYLQSIRQQAQAMEVDPQFADYQALYPMMQQMASTMTPDFFARPDALKSLYHMAQAEQSRVQPQAAAPPQAEQSYAQGVKDTYAEMQSRRAATVAPSTSANPNTVLAPRPTGRKMNTAVQQEFERALRDQRGV